MATVIISQDRDKLIGYSETDSLHSVPKIENGVLYGFNLKLHNETLGTFDSMKELIKEMTNIVNCKYPYYVVSGFDDYEECLIK